MWQVEDDIEGCFQRPTHIDITVASREYAPTAGIKPLREAVAKMYNAHHRVGKASQYTWENVAIVPGGRAGLIRIAAILNQAYLGFFIPDYTAYNEMLSLFRNVSWVMCIVTYSHPRPLWWAGGAGGGPGKGSLYEAAESRKQRLIGRLHM